MLHLAPGQFLSRKYSNLQVSPLHCKRLTPLIAWSLMENGKKPFVFRDDSGFHVKLVFYKTHDQWLCMAFWCSTRDMLWRTYLCNTISLSWWSQVSLACSVEADFCSCCRAWTSACSILFCSLWPNYYSSSSKKKMGNFWPPFFLWDLSLLLTPFFCCFHLTAYNWHS